MDFSNWYSKSITEAQERYKKEDEFNKEYERKVQENIDYQNELYDANYGTITIDLSEDEPITIISADDEDLLRFEDDGGVL